MIKGSCLCGEVRYEYDGVINEIALCHCKQCRKAQGVAFVTNTPVDSDKLTILKGQTLLKSFRSAPNKERVFCSNCGSPIYSAKDEMPDVKRLRVGTIDTEFVCENQYHIYVDSKASWHEITDKYPQYLTQKS